MARATFTTKVVSNNSRDFQRASQLVRTFIVREVTGELRARVVRVSRQAAPERTGRLARGLRGEIISGGLGVEVVSTARNPQSGYQYTGVTRFGHRKKWIRPVNRQFGASVIATGKRRGYRTAALRFTIGGKVLYRKRVRGYKPTHDWADDAMRLAEPHVARAGRRIGRELQAVIG